MILRDNIYQAGKNSLYGALVGEIKEWVGTPYRHAGCEKGQGADCVLFIGGILVKIGILKQIKYGYYSKDWYRNGHKEVVLDGLWENFFLNAAKPVSLLDVPVLQEAQPGDLLGFATNRKTGLVNHCAILLENGKVAHCVQGVGVDICMLSDTWKKRLKRIVRIAWAQNS